MRLKTPIKIVLPDTGPLISLAVADALDLLLLFSKDVRLALTDIVFHEATHRAPELPDAARILDFLSTHQGRFEVIETTIGKLALGDLMRRSKDSPDARLPSDIGELSITNLVISMRQENPGVPTLVLIEDDWFAANAYAMPGNVHVVSTSAWLDGLEALGRIESAAAIRQKIQQSRPHFRADFRVDREAEKVVGGSQWKSTLKPPKA